ncbi:MAG: O-antigen ligase family protein [Planctomycetota bacterium]
MAIALLLIAAGLLVWACLYADRVSLPLLAAATVVLGYVFGPEFWGAEVGPVTVTLDRLLLLTAACLFAWRVWRGRVAGSAVGGIDWALGLTLLWLTASAIAYRPGDADLLPKSPFWRLAVSFWAPAVLFVVTRQSPVDGRTVTAVLAMLTLLGGYLAVTALAETAGLWPLVFPRFIANPELGMHFGRARGPALNSVSLGVYLSVCFWAAWLLLPRCPRLVQPAVFVAMPLMAFGVLLTYTRSTWIGLAASGVAVLAVQLPRRLRMPVLTGVGVCGVLAGALLWQSVLYLEREDSGGVSRHSVQQRTAFAYVSWRMFCDHPLTGVGFGRFYDQKLPYLSDRSQVFELESLRELHHHNTFLGLLVETGMIGLAAYAAVLGGLLVCGWRLAHAAGAPAAIRSLGVLLIGAVMVYLPSAIFHDLTHVQSDQWLLFFVAGTAVGCERRLRSPLPAAVPATVHTRPAALA